ncbi:MAG: tyrosine--tRNA ligase [Christensenellales bacterium]
MTENNKIEDVIESLKEKSVDIFGLEELTEGLKSEKPLTIKFGCDPSRPDLHLGHTVPLRQLKKLQDLGHRIVFIIGDFTAMIGDPSGKSKTRPALTFEQTRASGKTYFNQVTKILDPNKTEIVYNSEWLSKMGFEDVLKLAGKYTVARLLERDDFALRFKDGIPIGVHEFFYPLMQGYDSVAIKADVEIGGTDQTFNLLVGRELQKDYGQKSQSVITFPLLVGLDGVNKMSKSLDNYIGIDEPADVIFEKCMRVPDNLLNSYFKLTTDLKAIDYIEAINKDIREAHFLYARTIVEMYHGKEAIKPAEDRYRSVAGGGVPANVKTYEVTEKELNAVSMLTMSGFASSNSEARKLVQNRGVKIDGEVVVDPLKMVDLTNGIVISKGKNNFAKFVKK